MRPFEETTRRLRTRILARWALCVGALLLAGAVAAPNATPAPGDITMFPLPSGQAPNYVAAGPDGKVWFTITGLTVPTGGVGKSTLDGAISEFAVPGGALDSPYGIAAGPDGNVWFTEIFGGKIGRITPSGAIAEFIVGGQPTGITAGPDGTLWFADMGLGGVRSITTAGTLGRQFFGFDNPRELVWGPDGNLWVTEFNAATITRITPLGSVVRFPLPAGTFFPRSIASGPDGNVWYTAPGTVGRITPTGTLTQFFPPSPFSLPFDLTAGADGNMWYTDRNTGKIGRVTPQGEITEFATPAPPGGLAGIAAGPDGNVWFADNAGRLGRIELEGDTTPPVLGLPSAVTADAISPLGADVSYDATATDTVDPSPTVSCSPPSGSTFPIGTTTVDCTASDSAGNTASGSFTVHVRGADEQIANLLGRVAGVGPGSSLTDKLVGARVALASGDAARACGRLRAFEQEVAAQTGKRLTAALAAELGAAVAQVRRVIGC